MKIGYNPIIFDLDGTLVDSSADIASSVNRTLVRLGMDELEESKIVGFVGDGVRALMTRTLCGTSLELDHAVKVLRRSIAITAWCEPSLIPVSTNYWMR